MTASDEIMLSYVAICTVWAGIILLGLWIKETLWPST